MSAPDVFVGRASPVVLSADERVRHREADEELLRCPWPASCADPTVEIVVERLTPAVILARLALGTALLIATMFVVALGIALAAR
jgi:hypothetical protein